MKQHEAVIEAMKANAGYATLGHLYKTALEVPGVEWHTKTPFASIRRIVQQRPEFFRIRPGLWALEEYRNRLPSAMLPEQEPSKESTEFNHSYYQGLLVEIGNLKGHDTFVPNQDKNRLFLEKPLHSLTTAKDIHPFTYTHLVQRARTVDVIWFNDRKMPSAFLEVEHTTDMQNSLAKFVDLQDFHSDFYIVAPQKRAQELQARLGYAAFSILKERVRFWSYDRVSETHTNMYKLAVAAGKSLF